MFKRVCVAVLLSTTPLWSTVAWSSDYFTGAHGDIGVIAINGNGFKTHGMELNIGYDFNAFLCMNLSVAYAKDDLAVDYLGTGANIEVGLPYRLHDELTIKPYVMFGGVYSDTKLTEEVCTNGECNLIRENKTDTQGVFGLGGRFVFINHINVNFSYQFSQLDLISLRIGLKF